MAAGEDSGMAALIRGGTPAGLPQDPAGQRRARALSEGGRGDAR